MLMEVMAVVLVDGVVWERGDRCCVVTLDALPSIMTGTGAARAGLTGDPLSPARIRRPRRRTSIRNSSRLRGVQQLEVTICLSAAISQINSSHASSKHTARTSTLSRQQVLGADGTQLQKMA